MLWKVTQTDSFPKFSNYRGFVHGPSYEKLGYYPHLTFLLMYELQIGPSNCNCAVIGIFRSPVAWGLCRQTVHRPSPPSLGHLSFICAIFSMKTPCFATSAGIFDLWKTQFTAHGLTENNGLVQLRVLFRVEYTSANVFALFTNLTTNVGL